ncbi:MAG: hypothetical protein PHH54_02725 [Candidatus Nanoarchaeia archaeon]|nr:hypothetical protein [Candidatus Nanoarchaeia archaeon]MDD5740874.1 hypothetical protein [Candidatus Nanoarchaeia archaeon]
MEENITHYVTRLNFLRELFKEHQHALLKENEERIKELVDGYNRFKNHPDYDRVLAEFPQVLIFN